MNSKVVVGERKYQFLKILQNSKVVKESVGALFNSSPPYAYFGFLHKANLATEGFEREIKEIEKRGKRRRRKRKKKTLCILWIPSQSQVWQQKALTRKFKIILLPISYRSKTLLSIV